MNRTSSRTTKRLAVALSLVAILLAAFLFIGFEDTPTSTAVQHEPQDQRNQKSGGQDDDPDTGSENKPDDDTAFFPYHSDINTNDIRELYAASDNLFIGTVNTKLPITRATTTIPDESGLITSHYNVAVKDVVKSSGPNPVSNDASQPESTTKVSQVGGLDPKTGKRLLAQKEDHAGGSQIDFLLKTGQSYLFATQDSDIYESRLLVVQPGGAQPIYGDDQRKALIDLYENVAEQVEASPGKYEPEGHENEQSGGTN